MEVFLHQWCHHKCLSLMWVTGFLLPMLEQTSWNLRNPSPLRQAFDPQLRQRWISPQALPSQCFHWRHLTYRTQTDRREGVKLTITASLSNEVQLHLMTATICCPGNLQCVMHQEAQSWSCSYDCPNNFLSTNLGEKAIQTSFIIPMTVCSMY